MATHRPKTSAKNTEGDTRPMIEGPQAFKRFDCTMLELLAVPHSELIRREQEYKKQAALNPRKRGPKPKRKSASRDSAS